MESLSIDYNLATGLVFLKLPKKNNFFHRDSDKSFDGSDNFTAPISCPTSFPYGDALPS